MQIDHKVAQLLVSRVCHDLAGGVNALSVGAQLLGDDPNMIDDEALNVIAMSARQSTGRLAFFRIAFGVGGGGDETIATAELKTLVDDYLQGGRVSLVWRAAPGRVAMTAGQFLLNMVLIGSEALPRGGVVSVDVSKMDGQLGFAVAAKGRGAVLRSDLVDAMRLDVDPAALSARTVHGFLTVILARSLAAEMEYASMGTDEIHLAAMM